MPTGERGARDQYVAGTLAPAVCDRARLARDRRFDGRFFIGVLTTRIYCRPICPVQPARSENVRFYPTAAAAEQAGFRPCLRCRPEVAPGSPAWSGSAATVSRGLTLINRGFLDEHGVPELAAVLGVGARHLTRLFEQHCGAPPGAVARTRRVQLAKRLLDQTPRPMTEIALAAGFSSLRRFNSVFRATYKRSPSQLRRRRPLTVEGDDAIALRLYYRPPYDWPAMLRFLAADALPGVECVKGSEYRRTIALRDSEGWFAARPASDEPALHIMLHLPDYAGLKTVIDRLHVMFDLTADPMSIRRALVGVLPDASRRPPVAGLRVPGAWDGFEVAIRTLIIQDAGRDRGARMIRALVQRVGQPIAVTQVASLNRLFPTPQALSRAPLRRYGLSAPLAASVRHLAQRVAHGTITFASGVAFPQLVDRLVTDAGLERPAAEWIGMRTLGEPDADVAGWLALPARARAWWRRRRTQETLRPWRTYAALLLAGAAHHQPPEALGAPVRVRHPTHGRGSGGRARRATRTE